MFRMSAPTTDITAACSGVPQDDPVLSITSVYMGSIKSITSSVFSPLNGSNLNSLASGRTAVRDSEGTEAAVVADFLADGSAKFGKWHCGRHFWLSRGDTIL